MDTRTVLAAVVVIAAGCAADAQGDGGDGSGATHRALSWECRCSTTAGAPAVFDYTPPAVPCANRVVNAQWVAEQSCKADLYPACTCLCCAIVNGGICQSSEPQDDPDPRAKEMYCGTRDPWTPECDAGILQRCE